MNKMDDADENKETLDGYLEYWRILELGRNEDGYLRVEASLWVYSEVIAPSSTSLMSENWAKSLRCGDIGGEP